MWYEKVSIDLENAADGFESDKIGVVIPYEYHPRKVDTTIMPQQHFRIMEALKAREAWRKDNQSPDWIGIPIAEVLSLDLKQKVARDKLRGIISNLEACGQIKLVKIKVHGDDKDGYTVHPVQHKMDLGPGNNPLA